jgi:hypothetical protein
MGAAQVAMAISQAIADFKTLRCIPFPDSLAHLPPPQAAGGLTAEN